MMKVRRKRKQCKLQLNYITTFRLKLGVQEGFISYLLLPLLPSTFRKLAYQCSIKLIPAKLDNTEMASTATKITRTSEMFLLMMVRRNWEEMKA